MPTGIKAIRQESMRPADAALGRKIYTTKMLGIVEKQKLIRLLAKKAMISESQAKAAVECIGPTVVELAGLGHGVQIPGFGTVRPVMKGLLDNQNRPIDSAGNLIAAPAIKFKMRFEKELNFLGNLETDVEYADFDYRTPIVSEVRDAASGDLNKTLTSGGMAAVKGKNLRFDPTKSDEGVWLMPVDGSQEGIVKVTTFLDNQPTRLSFSIPTELTPGTGYRIEIRARFGGSQVLRTSNCFTVLTVV